MSATGRGAQRHTDDFYATPAWVTRAVLPLLDKPKRVLEPCAGTGAIVLACRQQWPTATIDAVELDADRCAEIIGADHALCRNWFDVPWESRHSLIITNPPFKLALEFINRSLELADTVAMLLRLNFLGSQKRAPFWRTHPCGVYVLPRRPSFTEDNRTDSTEYAWFVWGNGHANRWGILDVDSTPAQVPLFGGAK